MSLMHILVVAELSCAQSGPYFHQTPLVIIKTHPPQNVTAAFFLPFFLTVEQLGVSESFTQAIIYQRFLLNFVFGCDF